MAKLKKNKEPKTIKYIAKQKDYTGAIEIYKSAAVIANNWDLKRDLEALEDTIRVTQIDGLLTLKKMLETEAKKAQKKKDYATAAEKFKQASKAASEIFKLGITEMTKEVKNLTNKLKEMEKLI